jgi:hypothetical protein
LTKPLVRCQEIAVVVHIVVVVVIKVVVIAVVGIHLANAAGLKVGARHAQSINVAAKGLHSGSHHNEARNGSSTRCGTLKAVVSNKATRRVSIEFPGFAQLGHDSGGIT